MAYTVNSAFNQFHDKIKLNKSDYELSLNSRNNLISNIDKLPKNTDNFPPLYREKHNKFGSFARKTKINPLDDIDLLICINAQGSTYYEYSPNNVKIISSNKAKSLLELSEENNILNSRKVIEKFKNNLKNISHYKNAEINRRQEAVTLSLDSYKWTFDIVPCFFTSPTNEGKTYYVIPNGKGNWKFTDPRIDQNRITNMNQRNNGHLLKIIRIFKHIANKYNLFNDNSYLLEVMILNFYENHPYKGQISEEIAKLLEYIKIHVQFSINDPQNIRTDINTLDNNEIEKIRKKLSEIHNLTLIAIDYENKAKTENAIKIWRIILGNKFPQYG